MASQAECEMWSADIHVLPDGLKTSVLEGRGGKF